MIKILLLDCSTEIEAKLKSKGFKVVSGSMGITNGIRHIPEALYEQNIIFFNPQPSDFFSNNTITYDKEGQPHLSGIEDETPEIRNLDIQDFFDKGGILFAFCNPLDLKVVKANAMKEFAAFDWIPKFPIPILTKDQKLKRPENLSDQNRDIAFLSVFRDFDLRLPVKRRLGHYGEYIYTQPLLLNARGDKISSYYDFNYSVENGRVVVLPEFESNDEIILHLATYVYPQLFEVKPDLPEKLNIKKSKRLEQLSNLVNEAEQAELKTQAELQTLRQQVIEESARVEKLIDSDETAVLIMGYLEDIYESRHASWHVSYKIAQRLYHEYGSEANAKAVLEAAKEINFIKKLTNETDKDTRHPPRKGETVNPLSEQDLETLIKASESLVEKHINYLIDKNDKTTATGTPTD